MKKNIMIIGSGGHAKVAIDCATKEGIYNIIGLIDDYRSPGSTTLGYTVYGGLQDIERITQEQKIDGWFIAVGSNYSRYVIKTRLDHLHLNYVSIVHPLAVISHDIHIPKGSIIMPMAVINAGSYIGDFTIINTGAIIEHDNVINDFASVSPGVVTGGNVHIGKFSYVGLNATIKHGVTIGEHTVIGAGSMVCNFIAAYKTAYGLPCKEVQDRKKDDKYL